MTQLLRLHPGRVCSSCSALILHLPTLRWAILADSPTANIHLQSFLNFLQATRNLDGAQTVRPCGFAYSYTTNPVTSIHMTSSKSSNRQYSCSRGFVTLKSKSRDCCDFVYSRDEMIDKLSGFRVSGHLIRDRLLFTIWTFRAPSVFHCRASSWKQ